MGSLAVPGHVTEPWFGQWGLGVTFRWDLTVSRWQGGHGGGCWEDPERGRGRAARAGGGPGDRQVAGWSQPLHPAAAGLALRPESDLWKDAGSDLHVFRDSLCGEETRQEQERAQGQQLGGPKPRAKEARSFLHTAGMHHARRRRPPDVCVPLCTTATPGPFTTRAGSTLSSEHYGHAAHPPPPSVDIYFFNI